MVDISSQNNKINITVSSSGNTANTNITPDYAQYYSEKSKEWAISNRIVDNIDYSSKHYANESKKQADISTAKATEVVESGNTAVSNIEYARDNAITDITNQESLSVDNVNTAGVTQIANVNSAGTTQINLAKEQVALATNQANIATEQATIATNKTSEVVESGNTALSNIDTAKTGAITDITNLKNTSISDITITKDNAITAITTQETTSKNNVIATGNEQVARIEATGNNYDNLTHKNITNCLLEVPQRIKYELVVGTLTIKAGSVVIVPYGVEDLTAQYPVGSVFINDNFRVYDTQFEDGKFFVWAEIQNDISRQVSGTLTSENFVQVSITRNSYWIPNKNNSTSGEIDGTTAGACFYNTATNLCKNHDNASDVTALPCMIIQGDGTYNTGIVNQVFNGMGYIGSTVWVDKGVKGLIPNGRNEDGTLNNIEVTTSYLKTIGYATSYKDYHLAIRISGNIDIYVSNSGGQPDRCEYKEIENINYNNHRKQQEFVVNVGKLSCDGTRITSFQPKLPFRAVDWSDNQLPQVDGQWVNKPIALSSATAINTYTLDLSNYLPNDGYNYEVLFVGSINNTGGSVCGVSIGTDIASLMSICRVKGTGSGTYAGNWNIILPVGQKRTVTYRLEGAVASSASFQAKLYRRLGTNL